MNTAPFGPHIDRTTGKFSYLTNEGGALSSTHAALLRQVVTVVITTCHVHQDSEMGKILEWELRDLDFSLYFATN